MQTDTTTMDYNNEFDWVKVYGKVEAEWVAFPSGNICFIVQGKHGKLFIKYAGPTLERDTQTSRERATLLAEGTKIYSLHPKNVPPLLTSGPVGEGFAVVQRFTGAFALNENLELPSNPLHHFPISTRLKLLDDLFQPLVQLDEMGYVQVDIKESNILINIGTEQAFFCDIDLFQSNAYINETGQVPGSYAFFAPEEMKKNAIVDQSTNVYHMGALAFAFLSVDGTWRKEGWQAFPSLYKIAKKATSNSKKNRHESCTQFYQQWARTLGYQGVDLNETPEAKKAKEEKIKREQEEAQTWAQAQAEAKTKAKADAKAEAKNRKNVIANKVITAMESFENVKINAQEWLREVGERIKYYFEEK